MQGSTGVDRIISHLGRTEVFLIVFLTCAAIYLPALGVPDLKGEEVRRILPAVAAALNSLVPGHEPIHLCKPGCQDSLFYVREPSEYLLDFAQIDGRVRFLLLRDCACQQLKDRSAIPSQLGHRSTASPTGSQGDFQLVELLTETR